jgi:hypothetical protein
MINNTPTDKSLVFKIAQILAFVVPVGIFMVLTFPLSIRDNSLILPASGLSAFFFWCLIRKKLLVTLQKYSSTAIGFTYPSVFFLIVALCWILLRSLLAPTFIEGGLGRLILIMLASLNLIWVVEAIQKKQDNQ